MKYLLMVAFVIGLNGCGSTTKTYDVVENNVTIDEPYPVPDGLAVILDGADDATVTVDNNTIIIDCGGSCGDISIGAEVLE